MNNVTMIKLRPHHILCIKHYEGKGYSEDFNAKMRDIITRLDSGERVRFVTGADDLCAACPHNKDGVCETEEKSARYDKKVSEFLQLKFDKEYCKREIAGLAQREIYGKDRFDAVCPDCEWSYICRKR